MDKWGKCGKLNDASSLSSSLFGLFNAEGMYKSEVLKCIILVKTCVKKLT